MFRQVPDGAMEKQNRSFVPMLSTSYRSDVASHREASEKVKTLFSRAALEDVLEWSDPVCDHNFVNFEILFLAGDIAWLLVW